MYEGINKVELEARVAEEPERREASGRSVCNLRVATRGPHRVLYITVVLYDADADEADLLVPGEWVHVRGKLRTREWQPRTGGKRSEIEICPAKLLCAGRPPGANSDDTHTGTADETPQHPHSRLVRPAVAVSSQHPEASRRTHTTNKETP